MSLYEGMFIVDNRQANRDWDGSLEKLKSLLTKHGAEILRCTKWGERKLAYEMDGRRRGTYVLIHFNASGTAVNGIYRECELSDLMLRALIVKIAKMPPEEAMLAPTDSASLPPSAAPGRPPEPVAPAAEKKEESKVSE